MDVLLTGANGFIGRRARIALAHHHRLFAVGRQRPSDLEAGIAWINADLASNAFVTALPEHIDVVVALAQSRHYRAFPEHACDLFDVNLRSLLMLLDWSRSRGVTRFVYVSSANVYAQGNQPLAEDSRIEPRSFYARTKYLGEQLVDSYSHMFETVVLRLFTVYGPGQRDTLIPQLRHRIAGRLAVQLQGQDGLRLSPVHVDDVCRVLAATVQEPLTSHGIGILNVGGPEVTSVRELAELIGQILTIEPTFVQIADGPCGGWVADCARLHARFGLPPFIMLRAGLSTAIQDVCANV